MVIIIIIKFITWLLYNNYIKIKVKIFYSKNIYNVSKNLLKQYKFIMLHNGINKRKINTLMIDRRCI